MPDLIKQSTAAPTRKVTAAALWGLFATIVLAAVKAFAPEQAAMLGTILPMAAPYVTAILAAYVTHEAA